MTPCKDIHFLLNGTWSPILTPQNSKLKVLRKNKITYSSFDLLNFSLPIPLCRQRPLQCSMPACNSIFKETDWFLSLSLVVCILYTLKNEKGKKIAAGAGSQVFSDRLGRIHIYLCGRQHGRAPKSTYPPALFRVARPLRLVISRFRSIRTEGLKAGRQ